MTAKGAWIFGFSIALAPAAWATDVQAVEPKQVVAAQEVAATPASYDVFIDGVTGYAFVKTPYGWKFIRSLREDPLLEANIVQRCACATGSGNR